MKRDEFAGRYLVKISSSVVLIVINAVIQLILPRALSVEGFGYYSYNLNVFVAVVAMANLSTSSALAAKYSKRPDEYGLVRFYLRYVAIVSLILNVAVVLLSKTVFSNTLFHGQTTFLVFLGLNAAVFNKLLTDTISMYDAQAISRFPALVQIALKSVIALMVAASFFVSTLDLRLFYTEQIIATIVAVTILLRELYKDNFAKYDKLIYGSSKAYIAEFVTYCKPLVAMMIWAQLNVVIMNWALMNYAGETAQAMYGIALQLNVLIATVFSPYAELLKREFAVVANNPEMLSFRYKQALRQMYWVTAYFSVYVFVCADWVILFLFGSKYMAAVPAVRLIMIYTVYQAWGQVSGSFFIATEKTKGYGRLSLIGLALTLILIFVLQVPNSLFPENLGSVGISLNYSICNFVSTSVMVIYTCTLLGIRKREILGIQLSALAECGISALAVRIVFKLFIRNATVNLFASGIMYSLIVLLICLRFPEQMGITRDTLEHLKGRVLKKNKR